jgi:trehalose 6-phosphate synthase
LPRVVLVSNRVVDLSKAAQAGGVAVVLADILRERDGLWFGWSGKIEEPDPAAQKPQQKAVRGPASSQMATLSLSQQEYDEYYLGYSNSVIWPVFHNRLDLAKFDAGFYQRYVDVNERFARELEPLLKPDDTIWIHDYHLIPLAEALRRRGVENPIGFFLHIPVPPAQTFLAIPEHEALAKSLSAYDLIGLQTRTDVANFIKFMEESVSGRIVQDGRIRVFDRLLTVKSFPVGIMPDDFADLGPAEPDREAEMGIMRAIGVDRLDYTKGLPQKFAAFGRFLEKYPAYRGKVILTQIAPPTRETVEAYTDIRTSLEGLSGKINGLYGELDWMPIHYIHRSAPRKRLTKIYRSSRIGLFTPLRDGMNLVAKEYIAAQDPEDPGVAILSRFAGAAEQLDDALIVNPYNLEEVADAVLRAIEMGKTERVARNERLLAKIKANDAATWTRSFLSTLETVAAKRLPATDVSRFIRELSQPTTHLL